MIYIGTDEGIYRWVDKSFWPSYHSLQEREVVSLACPAPGMLAVVDKLGRVWESDNNGIDWQEIPLPAAGSRRAVSVASGPSVGSYLLTTRPLGLFQRVVGSPIEAPMADDWSQPDSNPAWAWIDKAATGGMGLALGRKIKRISKRWQANGSENGAWTTLQAPPVSSEVFAPSIRTLAVGEGNAAPWYASVPLAGLWRSDDAGQSWQLCPNLPNEIYAIRIAPGPKEMVVVATGDGCWASVDRGQTWEDRSGGLEAARQLRALEIHPEDPNSMFAGAAALRLPGSPATSRPGTRFSLYETADGGKKWTLVRRGFPEVLEYDTITDIRYDPAATENAIVALDSGELWRTRNGGDWWEPIARQIRAARVLCATR